MGCSLRKDLNCFEVALVVCQKNLGFDKFSSQKLDYIIRKFSSGPEINSHQLSEIRQSMNQKIDWIQTEKILKEMKVNEQTYDKKGLLMLAIMLSSSFAMQKASLLFEVMDENQQKIINTNQILGLIDKMLQVSLDWTPLLYHAALDLPVDAKQMASYISDLQSRREQAKIILSNIFLRLDTENSGQLLKSQFVRLFSMDAHIEKLLTPSGIRKLVYQIPEPDSQVTVYF